MADHIELTYSELTSVISKISLINSNYLDTAYRQLKESTDLGSSLIQAGWKFAKKEEIFSTVKNAIEKIQKTETRNNNLIGVLNQIQSDYENDASVTAGGQISSWMKTALKAIGIGCASIASPVIATTVFTVWAGKKIVPAVSGVIQTTLPKISSAAKNLITTGVTTFPFISSGGSSDQNANNNNQPAQSASGGVSAAVGAAAADMSASATAATGTAAESTTDPTIMTDQQYEALSNALARYAGTPYLYGGDSINGIDCSGLVRQVFKESGINANLSHRAATMYTECTPVTSFKTDSVDLSSLRKGDLVFYGNGGAENIKHVGIYVGDGMVTSALNKKYDITTQKITFTNYTDIYVARATG